jgi:hypothetical protein
VKQLVSYLLLARPFRTFGFTLYLVLLVIQLGVAASGYASKLCCLCVQTDRQTRETQHGSGSSLRVNQLTVACCHFFRCVSFTLPSFVCYLPLETHY